MTARATTDAQLLAALKATFGYSTFRPLQAEVIGSIMAGRDVFVLMPTGSGKSLCYQLPALLFDGLTVVVSPLIALMKDQVDALQALGVAATFINSSLDPAEINRRQAAVARGAAKLLYVAPERLMLPGFLRLLSLTPVKLLAVDEAHCISEWGHDFRPEYRQLKRLRQLFPNAALGAFTATATPRVQADIKVQLGLEKAASFQGSYNRPNLYYEVRPKQDAYSQLIAYLRGRSAASGIVYCQARATTERLAAKLQADGFRATAYHAGLENEERRQRQEAFSKDDVQIIVATIAFGMGIDKPDVRFVVHYDLPKTLENYYQESGRAGRDGEPSDCLLFYTYADAAKQRYFIDAKPSAEERQVALHQLQKMIDWATSPVCRRSALLAYFEEKPAEKREPCCDVCQEPPPEVDYTVPTQMLLSCAKRTDERFGAAHLIAILRGSRASRLLRLGHDKLSTYGIGRDLSEQEWRFLVEALQRHGYIEKAESDSYAIKVTDRGRAVLFAGAQVLLPGQPMSRPVVAAPADYHEALFEQLRTLRKRLADERGVAPFVVFHDTTLKQMATELPTTREQLLRLQGVGQIKATEYGYAFLDCIARYVNETGVQPITPSPPLRHQPADLSSTARQSLDLFRAGQGLGEIAAGRHLSVTTVEGHLTQAIELGEEVDLSRLVDTGKRQTIEAAIAQVGSALLKPILEYLGEGYTYAELRFVRAALNRRSRPPLQPVDRHGMLEPNRQV